MIDKIAYDSASHAFIGITVDWLNRARAAYPSINVEREIKQAALWLEQNPPKKRHGRFLVNWLTRASARAQELKQRTNQHPGLKPALKRPSLDELVPQEEVRALINKLAEIKTMPKNKY